MSLHHLLKLRFSLASFPLHTFQAQARAIQFVTSSSLLFRRSFAEDVLDGSEKVLLKSRDEGAKVSETVGQTTESTKSATEKVRTQAEKEMNTARDMVKDLPQKTKETAQGIKEVGVEAAKAVKRDTERLAEKVGIKEKSLGIWTGLNLNSSHRPFPNGTGSVKLLETLLKTGKKHSANLRRDPENVRQMIIKFCSVESKILLQSPPQLVCAKMEEAAESILGHPKLFGNL